MIRFGNLDTGEIRDDILYWGRGFGDFWQRKVKDNWVYYKSSYRMKLFFITLKLRFLSNSYFTKGLIAVSFSMAHGQLLGSMGETRNGEGTR